MEPWNPDGYKNGDTRSWIFWKNRFSGAAEMVARAVVSLGFVGTFGYTAICFADQAAWIAACCYSVPTCLWCVKKSIAKLKQTK
ncbi:MAG: hypothetical protein ACLT8Y_04775 [Dorea formicigenerans]